MEGGETDGETRVMEVTARRPFMITDILSSVGRQDVGEEERKAPAGLDMRLLFPGLAGGQEDAEEGEEGEEDGEEGDRGEQGRGVATAKCLKTCGLWRQIGAATEWSTDKN